MNLYETTGVIEFIYGPTMNSAGAFSASIGLNDGSSFLSISPSIIEATSSNLVVNNAISSTTLLLGQKYTFTPQPQCSGTPNPGAVIASNVSVCGDDGKSPAV